MLCFSLYALSCRHFSVYESVELENGNKCTGSANWDTIVVNLVYFIHSFSCSSGTEQFHLESCADALPG